MKASARRVYFLMEDMLRRNDCDYLQGFLFSRPLAEENFIRFIREHNINN